VALETGFQMRGRRSPTRRPTQCQSSISSRYQTHERLSRGGKICSATTKPTVIASSRHAPINRGGAGDGMSKKRHPAPTTRPRTRPIIAVPMIVSSLECEAVTTEAPQPALANCPSARCRPECVNVAMSRPVRCGPLRLRTVRCAYPP
jgi:hypothetical protein